MLNASHSSFPELSTLQFIINRAWLQNLSKALYKATFIQLSSLAVLGSPDHPQTFLLIYIMHVKNILNYSFSPNSERSQQLGCWHCICGRQTLPCSVEEGAIFIFSGQSFSEQMDGREIFALFVCCCSLPLAAWGNSAASSAAGSPPGEMQCQRRAAFRRSPPLHTRSTYSLSQLESQPGHTSSTFQRTGK